MTLVGVFGPTGSGKTEVAVQLAQQLGTVVVNTDPAQCYAGLPILTNKPTAEHDAVAEHRMVGVWPSSHESSVAAFADEARVALRHELNEHGGVVAAGGSGLYMLAALTDLQFGNEARAQVRTRLEALVDEIGSPGAHAMLAERDPDLASDIHPNDAVRVVRGLELAGIERGSIWDAQPWHPATTVVHLVVERALIHERINTRTQQMFAGGLLEEVAALDLNDVSATFAKVHGLQDCLGLLGGQIDEREAVRRMATRTRQYAKRQDTWARRWPGIVAIDHDPARPDATVGAILKQLHAVR